MLPPEVTQSRAQRAIDVVDAAVNLIGCTNAPLVATSHAAKRTHFLPATLNGMRNCFFPKAGRSVA